jgi:hypothetical protein
MPHNWMKLDANTPRPWDELSGDPARFREAVEATVARYEGKSAGVFWDATQNVAYVLVKGPKDPTKLKALAKALPTLEVVPLLDEDEVGEAFRLGAEAD